MPNYRITSMLRGIRLLLASASLLLSACESGSGSGSNTNPCMQDTGGDNGADEMSDVGTPTGATCPDNNTLTYDSFGKMFVQNYCLRCHSSKLTCAQRMGAPSDHNFDVELGIIGNVKHIDEVAAAGPNAVNMMMPPGDPKPTVEERKQLGQWLACEAKNSGQ